MVAMMKYMVIILCSAYTTWKIKFETTDRQRQSSEGIANRPSRMAEKEIQLRRAQEEE